MSIDKLLAQSATIYQKSSYNKFGRDQESFGTVVACRFQDSTRLVQLPNQQTLTLVGVFYFPAGTSVASEDRVVYAGKNYKVFGYDSSIDSRGTNRIIKCTVTAWQT